MLWVRVLLGQPIQEGDVTQKWFISDHHLGHANILKFTDDRGNLIRPGFDDIHHMHEVMIANHNRVVAPTDNVYFLGDVGFNKEVLASLLPRFNGRKRLILGNHDYSDRQMMRFYLEHFQKVASWRHFTEPDAAFICTHVPMHESCLFGRFDGDCANVHGHIHQRVINTSGVPDPRYINVCVEQVNYTPVSYDWIMKRVRRLVGKE